MNEDIHISAHKQNELIDQQPKRASKISFQVSTEYAIVVKVKPHKKVQCKAVRVAAEIKICPQ